MDTNSHLFIKNAGNEFGEISAIANNEEKYVSFSLKIVWGEFEDKEGKKHKLFHEIRFLDSLKFMNYPLADLVKNLGERRFALLEKIFLPLKMLNCFQEKEFIPTNLWIRLRSLF